MDELPRALLGSTRARRRYSPWPMLTIVLVATFAIALPQQPAASGDAGKPPDAVQRAAARELDRAERHGITWRFDAARPVGTFCNGDPWVVGPVRIVAIDPKCATVGDRTCNGATVDPDPAQMKHGYDSLLFGQWSKENYDERRNVALAVARGEPLLLQPGQSLVSVISNPGAAGASGPVPHLQLAAVLTCLPEVPRDGAFRPPYCKAAAADKTVRFCEADLDLRALAQLQPVEGMPDVREFAATFDKLWLDHFPSWLGRFAHPTAAMKDYGRDLAADVGSAALLLNTDLPQQHKRDLLVRFVQFGIDTYGCLKSGCRWSGNGGHASGRKFPILFAGLLLHDEAMLAIGRAYPSERTQRDGPGTAFFGEDSQTFVVQETAPGEFNWGCGGYTKDHAGLAEWGFMHTDDPRKDDASWDGNDYRRCCTACCWLGYCLAARAMGLVEAWHHDAFFGYVDRYLQNEHRPEWRAWVKWHGAMWDRERSKY